MAILAASNWENATPAADAAEKLQIPFYYEIRGFWEVSRATVNDDYYGTSEYQQARDKEIEVAQRADAVFALSHPMSEDLISRGLSPESIHIVPNGIDSDYMLDVSLSERGNRPSGNTEYKFGYIGSFNSYEGLEDLMHAFAKFMETSKTDSTLAYIGSSGKSPRGIACQYSRNLLSLADQLGIRDRVEIRPRVTADQKPEIYENIDVVVVPRRSTSITELVPSVKPLEAVGFGKPTIVSDIAPHRAYMDYPEVFGFFSSGDIDDLSRALEDRSKLLAAPDGHIQEPVEKLHREYAYDKLIAPVTSLFRSLIREDQPPSAAEGFAGAGKLSSAKLQAVVLNEDPVWMELDGVQGREVIITASCRYPEGLPNLKKCAIALFEFIDNQGNLIEDNRPKGFGYSEKAGGIFRYLPCTSGLVVDLYKLMVPAKVQKLRVGFQKFIRATLPSPELNFSSIRMMDAEVFEVPSVRAQQMSVIGWPEPRSGIGPTILGIMDEFTQGCFEPNSRVVLPRPDNWYALMEKFPPEFVFIESAWKGNQGCWQYRVAEYAFNPGTEIPNIQSVCEQKSIPTIFWNKEDPVHHEKFIRTAGKVDHVFTTDVNMLPSYESKLGHNRVSVLQFAAQPELHAPRALQGRLPGSCFAGSWYSGRHADRDVSMEHLLDAASQYNLTIYDRNFGNSAFSFPEKYSAWIKGSLPYLDLCREYGNYRCFLNVNSVTQSSSMFSRRVFELLACGTPVVSTPSQGIESTFGDIVWIVESEEEARTAIHTLFNDDDIWRSRSLRGIRKVFSDHTYLHRLEQICTTIGVDFKFQLEPHIKLFVEIERPEQIAFLFEFSDRQLYPEFSIVACLATEDLLELSFPQGVDLVQGKVVDVASSMLATAACPYAGLLDTRNSYGENYLRDLINATAYAPGAIGWAKSQYDKDYFQFDVSTSFDAAIFKGNHFLSALETASVTDDAVLRGSEVYVIDAEEYQYQAAGAAASDGGIH